MLVPFEEVLATGHEDVYALRVCDELRRFSVNGSLLEKLDAIRAHGAIDSQRLVWCLYGCLLLGMGSARLPFTGRASMLVERMLRGASSCLGALDHGSVSVLGGSGVVRAVGIAALGPGAAALGPRGCLDSLVAWKARRPIRDPFVSRSRTFHLRSKHWIIERPRGPAARFGAGVPRRPRVLCPRLRPGHAGPGLLEYVRGLGLR